MASFWVVDRLFVRQWGEKSRVFESRHFGNEIKMGFVEELGPSIAEQDEDQVALCKICFSEGNDDCPLLHEVCDCKGSLDAVHGR